MAFSRGVLLLYYLSSCTAIVQVQGGAAACALAYCEAIEATPRAMAIPVPGTLPSIAPPRSDLGGVGIARADDRVLAPSTKRDVGAPLLHHPPNEITETPTRVPVNDTTAVKIAVTRTTPSPGFPQHDGRKRRAGGGVGPDGLPRNKTAEVKATPLANVDVEQGRAVAAERDTVTSPVPSTAKSLTWWCASPLDTGSAGGGPKAQSHCCATLHYAQPNGNVIMCCASLLMICLGFFIGMQDRECKKGAGRGIQVPRAPNGRLYSSSGTWADRKITSRRVFMLGTALLSLCGESEGGQYCSAGQW
jgi:hypothetical protein